MSISRNKRIALLASGGLDSAVLLADLLKKCRSVRPIYISNGNLWEKTELFWLKRYLTELRKTTAGKRLKPLIRLELSMKDTYQNLWSMTGRKIPGRRTKAEAVYLPGKNLLLIAKAAIYCAQKKILFLGIAPLKTNPFPDATRKFFDRYEKVLSLGLGTHIKILTPFLTLNKKQVMLRGKNLPLHLTFSCLNPKGLRHCGRCNKCEERKQAFRNARRTTSRGRG